VATIGRAIEAKACPCAYVEKMTGREMADATMTIAAREIHSDVG
jgi:hypothetical protein